MKKAVLCFVAWSLFFAVSAGADDSLPRRGKEGISVGIGSELSGFCFTPQKAQVSFVGELLATYAVLRYDAEYVSLGIDVGEAEMKAEKVFMNADDFSAPALFVRPSLIVVEQLTQDFKIGLNLSYAYVGYADNQEAEKFSNWQGVEKISLGPTHIVSVAVPLQWEPSTKASLYAGPRARFMRMSHARTNLSSPLWGHNFFEVGLDARNSYGAVAGATYDLASCFKLGLQFYLQSSEGSGAAAQATYHF